MNILIVEDEPILALDLEDMLESLGHTVVGVAASAQDAELLLGDRAPDMVLIDINIRGDRDGIEVARLVRERSRAGFAFATAHADQANLARMRELKPLGVLTKPYDFQRLAEVLDKATRATAPSL
jgi:CheY-like chemotaxis protein